MAASIASVVTRGFGSVGTTTLVVTAGYGIASTVPATFATLRVTTAAATVTVSVTAPTSAGSVQ